MCDVLWCVVLCRVVLCYVRRSSSSMVVTQMTL